MTEETLALFYRFFVDEQHFRPFRFGQSVDDRTPEPISQCIIDQSAQISPQGGDDHHQKDVECALLCQPCRGGNDGFRRKGYKRAFDRHADEDNPVTEVGKHPKNDRCHEKVERKERMKR